MEEVLALALEARGAVGHHAFALGGPDLAAKIRLAGFAELAFAAFWGAAMGEVVLIGEVHQHGLGLAWRDQDRKDPVVGRTIARLHCLPASRSSHPRPPIRRSPRPHGRGRWGMRLQDLCQRVCMHLFATFSILLPLLAEHKDWVLPV